MNCNVCGSSRARAYTQTLYGQSSRVELCGGHARSRRALGYTLTAEPYQYGWTRDEDGTVERMERRADAESSARDWAISPLRTGPRTGTLVRRQGWDGDWEVVATWASPEADR